MVNDLYISPEYLEKQKIAQTEEIKRRTLLYRGVGGDGNNEIASLSDNKDRTIVLVDDGAASGATLIVAARSIKKNYNPKKLIIAVPIATRDTVSLLKTQVDHVETIISPSKLAFKAVGQYYQDFSQITDEQVIEILKKRRTSRLL